VQAPNVFLQTIKVEHNVRLPTHCRPIFKTIDQSRCREHKENSKDSPSIITVIRAVPPLEGSKAVVTTPEPHPIDADASGQM
jgi:hypothetical protein